jgi:hypothetical protein
MIRRERRCLLAVLALTFALAFPCATLAHDGSSRPSPPEAREMFAGDLVHRLLAWLGLSPDAGGSVGTRSAREGKSLTGALPFLGSLADQGSQIDPNGNH